METTMTKRNPLSQTIAGDMGFWSIDIVTKEIFFCDRTRILIGIRDQLRINASTVLKLIEPSHRLIIVKMIKQACADGRRFQYEYPVYMEFSGEPAWLQITGQLHSNGSPETFQLIGTLVDITTKKQKDLLKDDLMVMLSHELKTPLSTIKLYVQMVHNMAKKANDQQATILLCKADNQVMEMDSIIESVLDMSLIASGKRTLQTRRFDMSILIEDVICNLSYTVRTHNITANNEGIQIICADRCKIKQAIHNLLSNALKYSPKQSDIIISSKFNGDHLQVSVGDKGPGISPEHQKKLFNRFYRAECDEVKTKEGYGIGLYIVDEIIRQHQGKIWVESVEGSGAVFHFALPVK
jgi:two-component system sensor histidine kinase VicK